MKDFNLNLEPKSESHSSKVPSSHPPIAKSKVGILIANLGTPDATNYWAVRRYLVNFYRIEELSTTPHDMADNTANYNINEETIF